MQGVAAAPALNYIKAKRIRLEKNPSISEKWIQDLIVKDPSILGLGDNLFLVGKEVTLRGGGRLDLLFGREDEERYEVEVQLGKTDESHIVRTIEYWDLERTRFPEREHVAVLVAEDITSRFLNVVSLLNKSIPLIAIQMQALEVEQYLTLVFTTVVNFARRDDEEDDTRTIADRSYWEKKSKAGLEIVDDLFASAQHIDPSLELKYNLGFLRVNKQGQIFLTATPQKVQTKIKVRMSKTAASEELKSKIEQSGLSIDYREAGEASRYRLAVDNDEFKDHAADIRALVSLGL
jgi:hypothetical protein